MLMLVWECEITVLYIKMCETRTQYVRLESSLSANHYYKLVTCNMYILSPNNKYLL